MPTVRDTLFQLITRFDMARVPNAKGSAAWIVESVLNVAPYEMQLMQDYELSAQDVAAIDQAAKRRENHEPLQYIFGLAPFYGRDFHVAPPVFIPRPETEMLVEMLIRSLPKDAHVLELCCGPATIAATLALERSDIYVLATDIAPEACVLAKQNIREFGVQKRVQIMQSNLFENISPKHFDALIANPPYIPNAFACDMEREVLAYEDHNALFSGEDGLDIFRAIIARAPEYLRTGATIAFELEASNVEQAACILDTHMWHDIRVACDMCERLRFLFATRKDARC